MLLVLNYHELSAAFPWRNACRLWRRWFVGHLDVLRDRGFQFARPQELDRLDPSGRHCVITFDDGRSGVLDAIDAVETAGAQAIFYVCPGWVADPGTVPRKERYSGWMKWSDVRELAERGHTIGSHTWSHRDLTQLDPTQCAVELLRSKKSIEDQIGEPCDDLALPWGQHNPDVLAAAQTLAGYLRVATTGTLVNRTPHRGLLMHRFPVTRWASPARFDRFLASLSGVGAEVRAHGSAYLPRYSQCQGSETTVRLKP